MVLSLVLGKLQKTSSGELVGLECWSRRPCLGCGRHECNAGDRRKSAPHDGIGVPKRSGGEVALECSQAELSSSAVSEIVWKKDVAFVDDTDLY